MNNDANGSYRTIKKTSEGIYKEKGSKFISFCFPVHSREEVSNRLQEIRRIHPKARHHCFAYRLGTDGLIFRSNDDGEPSGTAGRPILNQIDSYNLTEILIIVVRYFGGILLGASGLAKAYRLSAREGLDRAEIIKVEKTKKTKIIFAIGLMGKVLHILNELDVEIEHKELSSSPSVIINTPLLTTESILNRFLAKTLNKQLEEIDGRSDFPGLQIIEIEE